MANDLSFGPDTVNIYPSILIKSEIKMTLEYFGFKTDLLLIHNHTIFTQI